MINFLSELLKDRIAIGQIVNTHGLHGEVKLYPYTNQKTVLMNLSEVLLYDQKKKKYLLAKVKSVRKGSKTYLVKFEGIESIEDAEKLKGYKVYVMLSELPKPGKNEYYFYEVMGCEVVLENGENLGKVIDIIETGANDVIVVKKGKKETLIPMIKRYVVKLDKKEKKITVKNMEWI